MLRGEKKLPDEEAHLNRNDYLIIANRFMDKDTPTVKALAVAGEQQQQQQ